MKRFFLPIALVALAVLPVTSQEAAPVDFRFVDVTKEVGLEEWVRTSLNHAVGWGDFDGDGKVDLFLGNFADRPKQPKDGINTLFRQVAGGKFEFVHAPPLEKRGRCSGVVFVDLDNDGDLDLYVSSNTLPKPSTKEPYKTPQSEPSRLFRNDGGGKFVDISAECGACPPDLYRTRDIGVFDYDNDGLLDLFVTQDPLLVREKIVPHSRLFRNLGNLKFEDVTEKVGLPADMWALGIVVADLNGDQRPDFFLAGSDRLFLSQPGNKYKEAKAQSKVFDHGGDGQEDIIAGASLGDIDLDGDLDLITGPHYPQARVHVYLNEGLKDGVPQFREITKDIGIPLIPQKAPTTDIGDFDNDGLPDLYFSAYFAEGDKRWPFICKGLGTKGGLPRFKVPKIPNIDTKLAVKNLLPEKGMGMVYYVDGPAVDYDGDGRLDFFAGIWPTEGSRFFRNETKGGNWLEVKVVGKKMNRMGIGAQVKVYPTDASRQRLLGYSEISINTGYSSSRPAIAHFGLGANRAVNVEVTFPGHKAAHVVKGVETNRMIVVEEP